MALYVVFSVIAVIINYLVPKIREKVVEKIVDYLVAPIVDYLLAPIGRQLGYVYCLIGRLLGTLFCYSGNIEDFKKQVESLETERARLQQLVDVAKTNGEEVLPDVETWLTNVNKITEESMNFLNEELQVNTRFFNGRVCPNLKLRYQRSKEAKTKTTEVGELIRVGNFDSISRPKDFDSRKLILKEIMEALKDDRINMIGVYGAGGVGKTTLVEAVHRQAKEDNLFDDIVMAAVSQSLDIRRIQGEIADMLGPKLDKETEKGRARQLSTRLEKKKRILVILDDIWEEIQLEAIGIPFGAKHRGCKIILASRRLDVCNQMQSQKNFSIQVLPEKEAWDLFRKIAGDSVDSPDLHPLAVQIAKECAGLPIAIVTHATALKNKSFSEWRDATNQLRKSMIPNAEEFDSRKLILKEIMEALKDDRINMIGVYGAGGVGKTTLVEAVRRQAKEDNLFDEIVMAAVSQSLDIRRIQGEIADMLGSKLDAETEKGRARQLCTRLEKKKRILVILDDVWEVIQLEAIGIPFGAKQRGCKIVLTSRRLDVCNQMQSQKNFSIQVLPKKDAWNLFRKMAGDAVDSTDLHPLAVQIAKECGGLPIAIVTLATALKNKSLSHWSDAANQLRKSMIPSKKLFTTLKLSYDYLESEEAKSFFLLCCLYPEGHSISIQQLWECGIGLDLFQDVDTVFEASERAYRLANDLKSSCLLLDGLSKRSVKMHDVIRDVAISIASEDKHVFLVRTRPGWKEMQRKDTFKRYTAMSLWSKDIHELPSELECPQLQMLLLCPNPSLQFPNNFFLRMENLKVLVISRMNFLSLPPSLRHLKNLRTLCLRFCKLKDLSLIGQLEKLEILDLLNSNLKELPKEIGMLNHLKMLNLARCRDLTIIPPDIIGALSQLEGLYMEESFDKWEIERQDEERSSASLAELKQLSRIIFLSIDIRNPTLWLEDLLFLNLSRFRISIGNFRSNQWDDLSYSKSLRLEVKLTTPLKDGVKVLLKVAEYLQLTKMKGLKNLIYDLDREGFQHLRRLQVQKCDEVEYIFNSSECGALRDAFPMLEKLDLHRLRNLKEICHDQHPSGFSCRFHNLRVVKVFGCKGLKNLFSHSIAKDLSKLVELNVKSCKIMEQIFGNENEAAMDDLDFPHLRSVKLLWLPKLKNFALKDDLDFHNGQSLFNKKVALLALEDLEILGGGNFKEIWHPQFSAMSSFSRLKILKVANCNKLLNVIPFNLLQSLRSLEKLCVARCDSIEEIIEVGKLGVEEGHASAVLSQLRFLLLGKLPKLEHMWWDFLHGALGYQNLTSIHIFECNSLKSVFSPSIASSLVQLQSLKIVSCQMMETIIAKERDANIEIIVFPQLRTLVLQNLPKLMGFYTGRCTPNFPSSNDETNDEELDESTEEGDPCISIQPLFDDKATFPILKELEISGLDNLKDIWHPQLPTGSFCQLRFLAVERCHKLVNVVPSNLLKVLKNLEIVFVRKCDSVEIIFEIDAAEDIHGTRTLSQLRKLKLVALPKLFTSKHPLLQKPQMNNEEFEEKHGEGNSSILIQPLFDKSVALTKLEALWILEIENLQEIFHSQISDESLCQLEFLQVRGCPKLSRVAPSNLLPRLKKLKDLYVEECDSMKEIFELEGLVGEGHISLFQLKDVGLLHLRNLRIFCSGNYNFELLSLRRLTLEKCPKMQTFSSGSIITPKLNSIEITLKDREKRWKGSLNRTIEHLFQEKQQEEHRPSGSITRGNQ